MLKKTAGEKPRVAVVVTSVLVVRSFLVPHLKALSSVYDVTLLVKDDDPEFLAGMDLPVRVITIPIERKIDVKADLGALLGLLAIFRRERFDLVHTISPKAGLLGIVAAWLARVPIRIHTFQGEVWANKKGLWRWILRSMDRLVALLANRLTVVSESERRYLIDEGIIGEAKSCVLAKGSIGGVDLSRFKPDEAARKAARDSLSLGPADILFLYVGRLNADKGLLELGEAFRRLGGERADVHLLIVGPDEEDIRPRLAEAETELSGRLRFLPYTPRPEEVMAAADVLVLPSHREGFGVVVIEAAALGIPAIGTDIYGVTDAVERDSTGLLFEKGNAADLHRAMARLASDGALRLRMGEQARRRVLEHFDQKVVVDAFLTYYRTLLGIGPGVRISGVAK